MCARQRVDPDERLRELSAAAEAQGGRCLAERYESSDQKIEWECAEGHRWEALPGSVLRLGSWCPHCAGRVLTLEQVQELAVERGGECLSKRYRPYPAKLRFRCAEGHVFRASSSSVKSGRWCPKCARQPRYTLDDMRRAAEARGGECLSKRFRSMSHALRWRCAEGHEWKAPGVRVVTQGLWRCDPAGTG